MVQSVVERVYFVPPKGYPPFAFCMTNPQIIQPPDQYWHRVPEEYVVGEKYKKLPNGDYKPLLDAKGEIVKHTATRKVWAVDKAKNEAMKAGEVMPPRNWLDMSAEELVFIAQEKPEGHQYLKRESDVKAKQRNDYEMLRAEGEKEVEALKERIARAQNKLRAEAEKLEAQAKTSKKE